MGGDAFYLRPGIKDFVVLAVVCTAYGYFMQNVLLPGLVSGLAYLCKRSFVVVNRLAGHNDAI